MSQTQNMTKNKSTIFGDKKQSATREGAGHVRGGTQMGQYHQDVLKHNLQSIPDKSMKVLSQSLIEDDHGPNGLANQYKSN